MTRIPLPRTDRSERSPIPRPHAHVDPGDPCPHAVTFVIAVAVHLSPAHPTCRNRVDPAIATHRHGCGNSAATLRQLSVNSPSTLRQLSVKGSGRVEGVDHGYIRPIGEAAQSVAVQGLSGCRQLSVNSPATLRQGLNATFMAVDCGERCDVTFQPEDRLVDVQELAAYLEVPVKTLYAWRYRREGPPGFRVGRHLRYRWSDVELWIQQRIEPASTGSVSVSRRSVGRGG